MSDFEYSYTGNSQGGSITHPVGEVVNCKLTKKPHYTKRNRRDTSTIRVELDIMALGCDVDEVISREKEIVAAYTYGGGSFVLKDPSGIETSINLPATGVQVIVPPMIVEGPNLPDGRMEEGVTKRTIHVALETIWSEYESKIIYYEESYSHHGTSGMSWVAQNTLSGPVSYMTWPRTTEIIVQSGQSIGFDGYYLDGAIPNPIFANYEHLERRVEVLGKPINYGPNGAWLYFPAKWQYTFEVDSPTTYFPVPGLYG